MRNPELAEKFLRKADQDLVAFENWRSDAGIAEEIFGFHAQQAAEKMLKAALSARAIEFPLTHRLADLIDLCHEHGLKLPQDFDELRFLTPFAVDYRYDLHEYEEEEERIDFDRISALLRQLREWVDELISLKDKEISKDNMRKE